MKASELITLLQDVIDKYGDLYVETLDPTFGQIGWQIVPIDEAGCLDEETPELLALGPLTY